MTSLSITKTLTLSKLNLDVSRNRFAFLGLMTCLGCLAGFTLYWIGPYFDHWYIVVYPPPKIIQFVGFQGQQLFVKADDNSVYSCDTFRHRCEHVNALPSIPERSFCGEVGPETPILPGKVVDTLAFRGCGADGYVDVHFVALDDGSVWKSSDGQSAYDFFGIIPILVLLGAGSGLGLGLLILGVRPQR